MALPESREVVPERISRAVCVAPISIGDLSHRLQTRPISEVSFTESLLIRKSGDSIASPNLFMGVGGKRNDDETGLDAMFREIAEETTFYSLGRDNVNGRTGHIPFSYSISGDKYRDKPRIVEMFVHSVQSRDFSTLLPREGFNKGEDKIGEVVAFSPAELRQLVTTGSIQRDGNPINAARHFTTVESEIDEIEISEAEQSKQEIALSGILDEVETFELQMKNETLRMVNRLRRIKGHEGVRQLGDVENSNEIITGFVAAQMRLAFTDSRREEKAAGDVPLDPKTDLLKVLPYLSVVPPEMLPDLLLTLPTRGIADGLQKLEGGFNRAVETFISYVPLDADDRITMSYIEKLKFVWSRTKDLPLLEHVDLMRRSEVAMIDGLIQGYPNAPQEYILPTKDHIATAVKTMREFHDFITDELKKGNGAKDPSEDSSQVSEDRIFQEYRPKNQIRNAGLFTHMVYALGLYPAVDYNGTDTDDLKGLRFEALRDIAMFSFGLEVSKIMSEAHNDIFEGALNTFFDFPSERRQITLGEGLSHNVDHKIASDTGLHVLVDAKAKKEEVSAARKAAIAGVEAVADTFSINFVLADENFVDAGDQVQSRLDAAKELREGLLAHIREELGLPEDSERVRIKPKTHKTKTLDLAKDAEELAPTTYGGARAGSLGDAIIRDKFILQIFVEDPAVAISPDFEQIEVCIYPFESAKSPGVEHLDRAGLMGFVEKLQDDGYSERRLIERDSDHLTEPSFYELLYTGIFYEFLSERRRTQHVRKGRPL